MKISYANQKLANSCCELAQRLRSIAEEAGVDESSGSGYSVGFTACDSRTRVSQLTQHLAVVAGRDSSYPVLLVDANTSNSTFCNRDLPGIRQLMLNTASYDECVEFVGDGLSVLSARELSTTPELFSPRQLADTLEELKRRYKLVIVNLPTVTDQLVATLARLLDGVVLVLDSGSTTVKKVDLARQRLSREKVHLLGAVVAESM